MKNRHLRPFSIIATSKDWILENCIVSDKKILKKYPGNTTLIFKMKKNSNIAPNVSPLRDKIGVRIPRHWISNLVEELGFPIVTTSANVTGEDFMNSLKDLHPIIKSGGEFIIYEGEKKGVPSKIIDFSGGKRKILKN